MKKFFLLLIFLFGTSNAGREFIAVKPAEKLSEFIARRLQIMTHIDCKEHPGQENYWYAKLYELWGEVKSSTRIFKNYFDQEVNPETRQQRKVYNELIRALAKDKEVAETARVMGEAIGVHLLRVTRHGQNT